MARIDLPSLGDLTEAQRQQYDRFPSNLTRALLRTSASTSGYLSLGASFLEGQIENKDRELVILRVGALSGSAYERMQHLPRAKQTGWTDQDIAQIECGIGIDARTTDILSFVDECVKNVKVSDATFALAAKHLSQTQIAELTLLIGHYVMTARFVETLAVDLDESATDWDNMRSSELDRTEVKVIK